MYPVLVQAYLAPMLLLHKAAADFLRLYQQPQHRRGFQLHVYGNAEPSHARG